MHAQKQPKDLVGTQGKDGDEGRLMWVPCEGGEGGSEEGGSGVQQQQQVEEGGEGPSGGGSLSARGGRGGGVREVNGDEWLGFSSGCSSGGLVASSGCTSCTLQKQKTKCRRFLRSH